MIVVNRFRVTDADGLAFHAAAEPADRSVLDAALPALDADARAWLADRLADDHPWIPALRPDAETSAR